MSFLRGIHRRARTGGAFAICTALLAIGDASPVGAQTPPATQSPSAAPRIAVCDSARYREFDFWIGRWEVRTPDGKIAGHNQIEKTPSGCAIQERWVSAGGGHGTSLNFYDRSTGQWHQVWVDGRGGVLRLAGRRDGAAMVLVGTAANAAGRAQRQRITWSPLPGGRVRQLWETSDDGVRWQTSFDGEYRPVAAP